MTPKELLGEQIKQLREKAGLTQEELAGKAGIKDERTIRFWESGQNTPRLDNLVALAKALEVKIRDLFELLDNTL